MEEIEVLKNIIKSRRSTYPKDYINAEIDQNIVEEVLSAASFAPNHKKTKPWRFRVFRDEEKDKLGNKLAELYKSSTPPEMFLEKKYHDITHKISSTNTVITVSVNFSGLLPEWEEIAATAMAVQNMYLLCTAYKIGCYWSTPKLAEQLRFFLNLEENQKCLGLFYMSKITETEK